METIVIPILIILCLALFVNWINVTIHYHIIKCDIEDLDDKDLKIDLLQSLNDPLIVFFKGFVYSKDEFYFQDKESYFRFRLVKHIHPYFNKEKSEGFTYPEEL